MMRQRSGTPIAQRFAFVSMTLALAACGGSSGAQAPAPRASAAAAHQATLLEAARGVTTLALSAVALDRYYGFYLRPGVGTAFGSRPAQTTPSCDGATASASTSFPNQTGTQTLVTTAYYPAGDATCSQSPTRILVMNYTAAAGAVQNGVGYQIGYSNANDPIEQIGGLVVEEDSILTTIYNATDGRATIATSIAPTVATGITGVTAPPQPPPGTFPATFPANLSLPPPATPSGFYYSTAESGAKSTTAVVNLDGIFPGATSVGGIVGTADRFSVVASAPDTQGNVALASNDTGGQFVVDFGTTPIVVPPYPFASGATQLQIGPLTALGYRSSPANLPSPSAGSATYDRSGTLVACHHAYVDALDGVSVGVTCTNGGTALVLTIVDTIAKAPATTPAVIVMDTYGVSVPFTFKFDGSTDQIQFFAFL